MCTSSLSEHLLYEEKTESKGSTPHGSISAPLKLDIGFLKTCVLLISVSSHQAVLLVRKTLCFNLNI